MNDAELDAIAHRAAAGTRAEARGIADSDAELRRLLADSAAAAPAPLAPVAADRGPTRDADQRNPWKLVAVAAVFALFLGGIGYALVRGSGTIEIAGGPITSPAVGTAAVTSDQSDPASAPFTTPATTTPGTAATTPSTTAVGAPATAPASSNAPPSTAPFDPTAGFFVPELQPVTLDAVPRLLTTPPPPAERTYLSAGTGGVAEPTLSQLWVRTTSGDAVDAILHVTTRLSPAIRSGDTSSVAVPGWSSGRTWAMAPGHADIELWGDEVYVELWARGLSQDEVLGIAAELRADGSAWRAVSLDAGPWTLLQQMWSTGVAVRGAVVLSDDGDIDSELSVFVGADLLDSSAMVQLASDLRLVTVNGEPGLLGRPGSSGLVVALPTGTLVTISSRDPDADLIATVASLAEVDEATWDASGRPFPPDWDGCMSLFC